MSTIPGFNLDAAQVEADLNGEFHEMETGYNTNKAKREKMWKEYSFQKYGNEIKGASSIVDSTIFNAVEWMIPSLIQPFMETQSWMNLMPDGSDLKSIFTAEIHRELLNYQLRKKMDSYQWFYDTIKTFLVCGQSFTKITWQKRDKANGESVSRPVLTAIHPDAIRYDWTVRGGFMHSDVVTHEEDIRKGDVQAMRGQKGVLEDRLKAVMEAKGKTHRTPRLREEQQQSSQWVGEKNEEGSDALKFVLRREQWTLYDTKGDGTLTPVMAVFLNGTLVQFIENPYDFKRPPFVIAECVRDPRGNPAVGWAEILSSIQEYRTSILRMTSDNLNSQNNGLYEVDVTNVEALGLQLLQHAPAGSRVPIPVRKPGSIVPMSPAPIANQTFNIWELLEVAGENRGGFTRYSQGLDSKALNQTATGFVGITQRSEMRMWELAKRFAESMLKPLTRMLISLNQQKLEKQDLQLHFDIPELGIESGQWVELSKDDLGGYISVDIDVKVGSDRQQRINNLLQYTQTFAPYVGKVIPPEVISTVAVETAKEMNLPKVQLQLGESSVGTRGVSVPASALVQQQGGGTGAPPASPGDLGADSGAGPIGQTVEGQQALQASDIGGILGQGPGEVPEVPVG